MGAICNRYGIEVEHPKTGRKHLDIPEYKEYAAERETLKNSMSKLQADKMVHDAAIIEHEKKKAELRAKNDELRTKVERYNSAIGSRSEIDEIDKRRNSTVTGRVSLAQKDYETLKKTAMCGAYHKDTQNEYVRVLAQNKELQKRLEESKTSIMGQLRGDNRLEKEHSALKKRYAAAERVIQKNGLEKEFKAELTKSIGLSR
jgi:chromosome segregation ATPase